MTKVELTITPDYVKSWGVTDAVRELFQNALDQQTQSPDNKMSWEYIESDGVLRISNKLSKLEVSSLLFGSTTKLDDADTIGQFGEGYKIATLVLLRNNKPITFYNYGAREVWKPRFVKSKRFKSDILTFFIERESIWSNINNGNDLTIEVCNIDKDEYDELLVPFNLHMQGDVSKIESNMYGDVLADRRGMVYVNGLYVCKYEPYRYGYNFKPQYLKLDRDRKMVSDFDLQWLASKMWGISNNNNAVIDMIESGAADIKYIHYYTDNRLCDDAYIRFINKYGSNAIPVTTQEELSGVPSGYKGIIVSDIYRTSITRSSRYTQPEDDTIKPLDRLYSWFSGIEGKLDDNEVDEFNTIFDELK